MDQNNRKKKLQYALPEEAENQNENSAAATAAIVWNKKCLGFRFNRAFLSTTNRDVREGLNMGDEMAGFSNAGFTQNSKMYKPATDI